MPDRSCKAILFDFDGTLSETINQHFSAWKEAFSSKGVDIEGDDFFPVEGQNLMLMAKNICEKYHLSADPTEIYDIKEKIYLENHEFSLYPGVEELIEELIYNKIKIAIVTAGKRNRMNNSIPSDFSKMFDVIICGDDTERGKPFPDPFLKCIHDLKVGPLETVVVENAPFGVASAKASGAYVIAVCSTVGKEKLYEADEIYPSFSDISKSSLISSCI